MPGLWMAAVQQGGKAQGGRIDTMNPFSNSKRNLTALGHRLATRVRSMFHGTQPAATETANSRALLDRLGVGAALDHIVGSRVPDWRQRERVTARRRSARAKARDRARSHGVHYGNRLGEAGTYVCRVGDTWRWAQEAQR